MDDTTVELNRMKAEVREHIKNNELDVRGEEGVEYMGELVNIQHSSTPQEERFRKINLYLTAWMQTLSCPKGDTERLHHAIDILASDVHMEEQVRGTHGAHADIQTEVVKLTKESMEMDPKGAKEQLKRRRGEVFSQLTRLWLLCEKIQVGRPTPKSPHDVVPEPTAPQREVAGTFSTLAELLNQLCEVLFVELNCRVLEDKDKRTTHQDDFKFKNIMQMAALLEDPKDDFQALLMHVMKEANRNNFRRFGDGVFQQKIIYGLQTCQEEKDGVSRRVRRRVMIETHAWERTMDIRDYVHHVCDRTTNFTMWELLYSQKSGAYAERITSYLEDTSDSLFPRLDREKMRNKYSFKDGLYDGNEQKFYPYDHTLGTTPPSDMASCKYIPSEFLYSAGLYNWRGDGEGLEIPENTSSFEETVRDAATGDAVLDAAGKEVKQKVERGGWYDDIPTPALQKIFDSQYLGGDPSMCESDEERAAIEAKHREVCKWLYVFLGRLLYPLNTMDKWQVVLFVKGHAGTGKSTMGQMVKMWFDPADIGILSNNAQTQFALWDLYDKMVYICFEVKNNFRLDQAELQSIISGEDVCIYRKHKNAVTQEWTVPGIFMGNEAGDWFNSSNSISRRMVLCRFDHKPKEPNPNLLGELREELPAILLKCNRAYRDAVETFGNRDIWKVLPDYFTATQRHMQETTNPFTSFLKAHVNLDKGEDLFMPLNDLAAMFREYCDTNGHPRHKTQWNEDMYMTAFREQTPPLTVRTATHSYQGRAPYSGEWVYGITARTILPSGSGVLVE